VGNIPTNEGTPVPCSDNTIGTGVIKPVVSDSELNLVINATIVNSDENTLVTSQAENGTSALNSELYVSLESDLSQSVAVSITENQSVPASCKSIPSSTASTQSVQQDEPEELLPINNTEVEREVPEADQPVSEKSLQVKETETNQSVDVNNNELEVTEEPISSQVELTVNTIAVSSELVSEQVVIVTDRPSTPPPQSVPVQKEPVVVSVTVPETKPVAAMPTKPTETPAALTDNKPSSLVKERIASYAAIIASNKPEDKKTTASAVVAPAKPPRLAQNQQPVVKTESAPIVKPVATSTSVNQNSTPTTAKPIVNSPLKKTQSYASDSQTRKSPVSSAGQALVKNEKVVVKRSNTNTSTAKPETRGKKQDEVVTPPSRDKKSAVVEVKNGSVDRGEESASTITYEEIVVYEFNFPRRLCGKLIGKSGVHVDNIRTRTRTQIAVRNDPSVEDLQIVCVSGKLEDVDHALEIISNRFPAKHYSSVSFKPITKPIVYRRQKSIFENNLKVFLAPNMFVELLQYLPTAGNSGKTGEVGNSDFVSEDKFPDMALAVHVASVVNAAHVFIQLPSNPMFEHLPKLDTAMTDAYYAESGETEQLLMSEPVENGTICAAPTSYGWHRVVVTNYMSKTDVLKEISDYDEPCGLVTIKFLDYGGYLTIPANQLRQLRFICSFNFILFIFSKFNY
jgi:A-kinase anchor protein 1